MCTSLCTNLASIFIYTKIQLQAMFPWSVWHEKKIYGYIVSSIINHTFKVHYHWKCLQNCCIFSFFFLFSHRSQIERTWSGLLCDYCSGIFFFSLSHHATLYCTAYARRWIFPILFLTSECFHWICDCTWKCALFTEHRVPANINEL